MTNAAMISQQQLVDLGQAYAFAANVELETASGRVFADRKVLRRLVEGKGSITMDRAARAWEWFADHWPSDTLWPQTIPLPSKPHQLESA